MPSGVCNSLSIINSLLAVTFVQTVLFPVLAPPDVAILTSETSYVRNCPRVLEMPLRTCILPDTNQFELIVGLKP